MLKRALIFDAHLDALGGTEAAAAGLAEALAGEGWRVELAGGRRAPRAAALDRLFGTRLRARGVRVSGDWLRRGAALPARTRRFRLVVNAGPARSFPSFAPHSWLWLHYLPARRPAALAHWRVLANGPETAAAAARRWGSAADILPPPVPSFTTPRTGKRRLIVGAGRLGDGKGERELLGLFASLYRAGRLPGWSFAWAAPAGAPAAAAAFRRAASGLPARLLVSPPRRAYEGLLARAALFWGGLAPETFGVCAAEAGAAGCAVLSPRRPGGLGSLAAQTLSLVSGSAPAPPPPPRPDFTTRLRSLLRDVR